MFTGIIEGRGKIVSMERTNEGASLELLMGPLSEGVQIGDSIALDGCCLTVTGLAGDRATFQAVPETLSMTTLGSRRPAEELNLERSLRLGERLGGHLVSGHVDGVGKIRGLTTRGLETDLEIETPAPLLRYLIHKGSVAVDGISLTIARLTENGFVVAVIPHTLGVTTLGRKRPADLVNLETDVLGKWVGRLLERGRMESTLELDELARAGFVGRGQDPGN